MVDDPDPHVLHDIPHILHGAPDELREFPHARNCLRLPFDYSFVTEFETTGS